MHFELPAPPRRRAGRALLYVVVLLVITGLVAWAWAVVKLKNDGTEPGAGEAQRAMSGSPNWFDVREMTFELTVIATGELEAKNKVELKSEVDGQTTIVEVVDEGKTVKKGDVLVRLADDQIKAKIEQETLDTERSRAELVAAQQALAIQESENKSGEDSARLKLNLFELDLAKWRQGADPQKQRELKLALEKAQRTLVRARRDVELSQQLYDEKFISLGELEDDQIEVIEAENALASAELAIKVYDQYERPKEERKAESDVEQAKAELDRTLRKNASDLARVTADLDSKTRQLKIREDRLAKLLEQLEACTIKAPQDGLVVYATSVGPSWRRGSPIAQGRQIQFNEAILMLPDTRQMVAALRVHEAMLPQVAPGQTVSLTMDADPSKTIEGTVANISVMAEDSGWMNPDLREYVVRVDLPAEATGALKPAMRCTGQIVTGRVENALAVPIQAVFSEKSQRFVYAQDGGSVVRREVKVGRVSESFAEITQGLTSGDRALLRKPRPGEVSRGG